MIPNFCISYADDTSFLVSDTNINLIERSDLNKVRLCEHIEIDSGK